MATPFPPPYKEIPIVFGEWWKADTEKVISQALQLGGGPNVSDAFTMNGLPGPLYNCSARDVFKLKVETGKTYMLRLINAALDDEMFFTIAGHNLTVVEADAIYMKPFQTDVVLLTPGQTTNVLLTANNPRPNSKFLMAARPYATSPAPFDNSTTSAILEYELNSNATGGGSPILKPSLPNFNDTNFAAKFAGKFRSLNSVRFPANVCCNLHCRSRSRTF